MEWEHEDGDLREDALIERMNRWAPAWTMAGAAAWAGMAALGRWSEIELLFLLAPLVIVPLGLELGRRLGATGGLGELARLLQPVGAALAAAALWLSPGWTAGVMALPWMMVCLLAAADGLMELLSSARRNPVRALLAVAKIDLAVGGTWLVASRLGMRPMGMGDPIGLLTAVHFHFAGFATTTIAAATLSARKRAEDWVKGLAGLVAVMPFVVAAGFVVSPWLKTGAAVMFSASVAVLAIVVHGCGRHAEEATARLLLQLAAVAVFAGMVLSTVYAVAELRGSVVLTIPQMARTHGLLNAMGFCLLGILGWVVENSGRSQDA